MVPTLFLSSRWHSAITTTTTSLSEAEGALGIIHPGGPQRLQGADLPRCVHNSMSVDFWGQHPEMPPESQGGVEGRARPK